MTAQDPRECIYLLKEFNTLEDCVYFRCDKFNKGNAEYKCLYCPDFTPKNDKK